MYGLPLLKLFGAILVLTAIGSLMVIPDWNGVQASTAAGDIDRLLDISIVFSSFVFAVVIVMLGYSIIKWRAKPGDESDGEPIHGNTRLEIAWTAIPTVIVLFLAAISWIVLEDIEAQDSDRMVVDVYAQQFAWRFEYPEEGVTSRELNVPIDRQVEFRLHALDVIHSFWVPEWRMKKDVVPGITTRTYVTPNELGEFTLVCTELCGLGHSTMRAPVETMTVQGFDEWVAEQEPIPPESTGGDTIPPSPDEAE